MPKKAKKKKPARKKKARKKVVERRADGIFSPDEVEHIHDMAGHGLTVQQMAAALRCSKRTFERRIAKTPGGREELEAGRAETINDVAGTLVKNAKKGVAWAVCFFLKTKGGYKEVSKVETEDVGDAKAAVEADREKRRKEIARLKAKLDADGSGRKKA